MYHYQSKTSVRICTGFQVVLIRLACTCDILMTNDVLTQMLLKFHDYLDNPESKYSPLCTTLASAFLP